MPGSSIPFPELLQDSDGGSNEAFESLLKRADFSGFVASRDLPPLRARLLKLEREKGVTDLHRWVSERVLETGARLVETPRYTSPQRSFALSPSGRHLAITSDRVDPYFGGELRVWELETGRVVDVHGFNEGVGGEESSCVQWSPSGQWLGVIFNQVAIGVVRAFSQARPSFTVDITRRWGSPPAWAFKRPEDAANRGHLPAWCWSPDETHLFVSTPGPDGALGCIVPFREGAALNEDSEGLRWCPARSGTSHSSLNPHTWVRWSHDGSRLYGYRYPLGGEWDDEAHDYTGVGSASAIDAGSGALRFHAGGVRLPVAFSPDGSRLVHGGERRGYAERIELVDGHTGHRLATLSEQIPEPEEGEPTFSELVWSPDGKRLAVLMDENYLPMICVFEGEKLLCQLEIESPPVVVETCSDRRRWAWSPDGSMGACLTRGGGVELWDIGPVPRRIRQLTGIGGLNGLVWGADDTLVGIGHDALAFWSATSGELRAHASFAIEAGHIPPPKSWFPWPNEPGQFLPTERGWAFTHVYPDGTVVCPPGTREQLESRLMFSVAGRHAWPWRWAIGTRHTRLDDRGPGPARSAPEREARVGTLHISHYRAHPVFERGPDLRRDSLAPHVGQMVLLSFSDSYSVIDLASLLEVTEDGVRIRRQSHRGPDPEKLIPFSSIHWIGPAVLLDEPEHLAGPKGSAE
ncbi:WD40 repeat domain-containing protein [Archangium violaceum]|uniref:WD40 repeat domain-containing protein n=1 Tax=Archangium violaceum TaxID=83451 RepID=UPI0036D779FF